MFRRRDRDVCFGDSGSDPALVRRRKAIKAIARDLHVSRKVIRKAIPAPEGAFDYRRKIQPLPRIGPFQDRLDVLLEENELRDRRDRLRMTHIHDLLVREGFEGSYDAVRRYAEAHIGVAVGIDEGLIIPVIRDCNTKTLRQISEEVKDLAGRARSKQLAPQEDQGGTSSVSNLGMYGIKEFGAVINPPHGTILAVGVGEERVYAEKGEIKIGQFMTVTCACDHRAVDGALGAELLAAFKALIETPVMMLA